MIQNVRNINVTKIQSVLFAIALLLLLLSPTILFITNKTLRIGIPDFMLPESAQYLSGGMVKTDLIGHISYEDFTQKKLQEQLEATIENNIPLKRIALLGNASLQRIFIAASNAFFHWECYPTYYSSDYVICPDLNSVIIRSLTITKENTDAGKSFVDAINLIHNENPTINIVYQSIDDTHSSDANPSHKLQSNVYSREWLENTIHSRLASSITGIIDSIENKEELASLWFSSEHHWTLERALKSYNILTDALDLMPVAYRNPVTVCAEWEGSNARNGLALDYPSSLEDIPTSFSHLNCMIDGQPTTRGMRGNTLDNNLPLKSVPEYAYYNMYHYWFGGCLPEVVYENDNAPDDRVLLFIEQSYGVPLEPYLASNFRRTICIAPANTAVDRSIQDYIDAYGVTDILVQFGPHPYSYMPNRSPKMLYSPQQD